jgi:hypothetical protein
MRTIALVLALILTVSGLAAAQELVDFQSPRDGFKVYFPAEPTVTDITWKSQQGYTLPGRLYTVERRPQRFSIMAIDYSGIEQIGIEAVKTCHPGAPLCNGTEISGPGLWKHDVRGAERYATMKLLQRDAKLTDLTWSQHDMVEGTEIQLLHPDGSRTYAYVTMHEMKLYILEATVPKGYPPATLFQSSMTWIDKDGKVIRYQTVYTNQFHGLRQYPVPPRAGAAAAP